MAEASWQEISIHLDKVVAFLKSQLSQAITIQTHGGRFTDEDLAQVSTKTPALLVSVQRILTKRSNNRALPSQQLPGQVIPPAARAAMIHVDLSIAITIVTRDAPGLERHTAAVNLAQFLSLILPQQTFGNNIASPVPANIDSRNLFSAKIDKSKKVAFWGCAFNQTLEFVLPAANELPPAGIYVSTEERYGDANLPHYKNLKPAAGRD